MIDIVSKPKDNRWMKPLKVWMLFFFAALLVTIVILGSNIVSHSLEKDGSQTEIIMGIVVVTAIAAMLTLLYILAVGFNFMKLADAKQALGLPEGSIRAMIALILIMVFVMFGIYLYRSVSFGFSIPLKQGISADSLNTNLATYRDLPGTLDVEFNKKDNTYSILITNQTSQDGTKLAQQLITTVGTLVAAISAFYFGSSSANSAMTKARDSLLAAGTITGGADDKNKKV
jgi:energy-coupling factor transporter transmembrane protein EcfT